jgi:glycosyltransferase involved in cell wall biosynthesis
MKLLWIKVGKALKTIERDGIFRGGKRVLAAFFAMFAYVGKGQILFITGGVGDSARYRTHHVSQELELQGFTCSVTVQDNPLLASYVDKFEVFIFHRVLFTPSVKKMMEKIKQQKKEIIFETDDLVYDPKYLQHMDYFKVMNTLEKKLYENGVGGEILHDPYVKTCTTTTKFLADKLAECNKKVFIVPNRLSNEDVQIAQEVVRQKSKVKNQKFIRLGYFSGTLSHNKDFATINDALLQIMKKHENVELFLVGPLDLENKLQTYKERIRQFPYVARSEHFANLAKIDVNLVPLELENPFCESKSELKFFEAGIVGVPTVAVDNQTFRLAIVDGEDGYLAKGTEQWILKLEKLIEDENLRIHMGEKAREKALQNYTNQNADNQEYYNYLRSRIVN